MRKFHSPLISMKNLSLCLALLLSLGLSACSSKSGAGPGGADGYGASGVFSDDDLALAERYGDGNIPNAQEGGLYGAGRGRLGAFGAGANGEGPFQDVRFDYDSSEIPFQYRAQLEQDAQILKEDPTLKVEIEGHCDSRGTNEYNLALGKSRAKTVARYLVNLGVQPDQLSTITYGEEIPLETGESESSFSVNRRAHFAIFRNQASSQGQGAEINY